MKQNILRHISALSLAVCMIFLALSLFSCNRGSNTAVTTDVTTAAEPEADETTTENTSSEKEDEPVETLYGAPCDHISAKGNLDVKMTEIFKISDHTDANNIHCRVVQGGCTDGKYYYVALNNNDKTENSVNAILKYEIATGKLVLVVEGVKTSHFNDMTYNPETNEFFIVHNQPDRQHISVWDPETLKVTRLIELENLEIYSLSYDPYEKCYWAGISYGFDFVKLDLNFKQVGEVIKGVETGYTKQGMDVDEKYIYFLQYKSNAIIVYDKQGNFVREILLPKTSYEAENIFHIGDVFYIGYYKTKAGGMLYKTELKKLSNYDASIELTDFKTVAPRTDDKGNSYTFGQGTCTIGNYMYLMMNNDTLENYLSSLHKIDLTTGEVVQTVDGLPLGKSNDIAYNPKTNEIIVATDDPDKTKIAILDADTLTVKATKKLDKKVYAVAYDNEKDGYWFALSGSYDFAFFDKNFNQVGDTYSGHSTGATKQGIEFADGFIYCLHSNQNTITIYKNDGTFAAKVDLPELNVVSAQNICYADGAFYISCHVENEGCVIYKAEIKLEK